MRCPSAIIDAAQVFATADPAASLIIFKVASLAAIFPMASEAVRRARVRALRREATLTTERERERLEREAYARRLFSEARSPPRKPPQTPEERERRRAAADEARAREAARVNAEFPAVAIARQCLHDLRYHAETVRQRDENVFRPEIDAWCRGRELPRLNDNGHVPGMDPTGRVLALIGGRLVYVRRTRLFASLALGSMLALRDDAKEHPPADCLAIVREARAFFWDTLIAMRALDAEWRI
jgi:hypothetical protein